MRFLIDSFSPEEIKKVLEYYPAEGVTTNPAIISRERRPLKATLLTIRELIGEKMLHVQTMQKESDAMVDEALKLRDELSVTPDGHDFFIKLPAVPEGLKACAYLSKKGVNVTMTAIFTPMQALLSARCGARFVAPYVNKLDDVGDGEACVEKTARLFEAHKLDTKILSASFRNVSQVTRVALSGSHFCTLPPAFFEKLTYHPMTENALTGFESDWLSAYGNKMPSELMEE